MHISQNDFKAWSIDSILLIKSSNGACHAIRLNDIFSYKFLRRKVLTILVFKSMSEKRRIFSFRVLFASLEMLIAKMLIYSIGFLIFIRTIIIIYDMLLALL
jgi:hypothetical protein